MINIEERDERYFPQIITAYDDIGRIVVRASRHMVEDEWSVIINTSPRTLPDFKVPGKSDTFIRNLVEMLAEAIETRGVMPTHPEELIRRNSS